MNYKVLIFKNILSVVLMTSNAAIASLLMSSNAIRLLLSSIVIILVYFIMKKILLRYLTIKGLILLKDYILLCFTIIGACFFILLL